MHELGYTKDIVDRVTQAAHAAHAHSVKSVFLTIGEMRDIMDDLLKQCFRWMARDTVAADASVVIDRIPFEVRCNECGSLFHFDPWGGKACPCPGCGSTDYAVVSGMEFAIDHIEVV